MPAPGLSLLPQGEMINESGTMSGGGGKPRGGRMRLGSAAPKAADPRAAAAELQAAEQELAASQEALRAARDALNDAAQEAKTAERALAGLETSIPKVAGLGWVAGWVTGLGRRPSSQCTAGACSDSQEAQHD